MVLPGPTEVERPPVLFGGRGPRSVTLPHGEALVEVDQDRRDRHQRDDDQPGDDSYGGENAHATYGRRFRWSTDRPMGWTPIGRVAPVAAERTSHRPAPGTRRS